MSDAGFQDIVLSTVAAIADARRTDVVDRAALTRCLIAAGAAKDWRAVDEALDALIARDLILPSLIQPETHVEMSTTGRTFVQCIELPLWRRIQLDAAVRDHGSRP